MINLKINLIKGIKQKPSRAILGIIAIFIAFLAILPILTLVLESLKGVRDGSLNFGLDGIRQIRGTITLLFFTSLIGGLIGTTNGWLLANCRFPGRKILKVAQLIPIATPAYLLAATLIDLGSIYSIRIYGIFWGILIMSLTTYPYVFLLSTESFSICGQRQLEACRSLGIGPWNSFRRIALPMALPAIGAGIALMSMEVLNELGAVELLNIPSISAGIIESWVSEGNPSGAIGLALIALVIVITLVLYEKYLRRKSRRWTEGLAGGEAPEWELNGIRAFLAQSITFIPPAFTLGTPLIWAIVNVEQMQRGLDLELFILTIRSFGLGVIAAVISVVAALFLSITKRWTKSKFINVVTFIAGIGYAIPGVVLALALLTLNSSAIRIAPVILLIWGYSDRFLAVAKGGLDAAFERISPSIDEAATGLGCKWPGVTKRIHLPLLKGPLAVGTLLVFVDTLKELPLTFVLRPFDFDTLSVRLYQYAGDERMAESILPALIILGLGLLASIALIPSLENKKVN